MKTKQKFIVVKFSDGAIIASEWSEVLDGPWLYGKEDEHVIN